jgi:hypothetical protein
MNMLKSMGADALGTADNCVPVSLQDLQSIGDLLSFVPPREKPWIILKSKIKEYIFTDFALIEIERDNASGKFLYYFRLQSSCNRNLFVCSGTKRLVTRIDYFTNDITAVRFETAGTGMTDLACEIKFIMGQRHFSIDVQKAHTETAKNYYLLLVDLSAVQRMQSVRKRTLLESVHKMILSDPAHIGSFFQQMNSILDVYDSESYSHVFQRHFSVN